MRCHGRRTSPQPGSNSLTDGSLLLATWQTFETALVGLAIATVIGVLAGTILGLLPLVEGVTGPTIEALRPIPAIAFMPLALMMFGFGVAHGGEHRRLCLRLADPDRHD